MQLQQLAKPWYVWRPWQLARRAGALWSTPPSGYERLPVAWGASVVADPSKTIGRSIRTTGVYDLAVSEVLARLISPGDTVVDAGANVGYMTLLAAMAAGPRGCVMSWEPHPELFHILTANVTTIQRQWCVAGIQLRNLALGEARGRADLVLPSHMTANDGVAYLGTRTDDGSSVSVAVEALDGVIGTARVAVMKLDVEGSELAVLKGAERAIASRSIPHIVFEDHVGAGSEVNRWLASHGYRIYSIGWSLRGLRLSDRPGDRLAADYEAPNYVASLEPDELMRRCSTNGWITLSSALRRRLACASPS
jgi:FkbM family methyltransferase